MGTGGEEPGSPGSPGEGLVPGLAAPRMEPEATPSSSLLSPQIPIAVSGVRGMGFLMKHHIETGGGQLPAKLSSLFIKVSRAARLVRRTRDQRTPEVCPLYSRSSPWIACGVSEPIGLECKMVVCEFFSGGVPNFFFFFAQLFVRMSNRPMTPNHVKNLYFRHSS